MAEIPNNHLGGCWNPINNGMFTTNLNWWNRQISGTHQQYVFKFPMSFPNVLGVLHLVFWDPQLQQKPIYQAALYPMVDLLGTVKRVSLLPVASAPAISEVSKIPRFSPGKFTFFEAYLDVPGT